MASLYNSTSDNSHPIETMQELRAAMPAVPVNPSIWSIDDVPGNIVQVVYGSPDRHHAEVKHITGDGVKRETFDTFNAATDRFFVLAQDALK